GRVVEHEHAAKTHRECGIHWIDGPVANFVSFEYPSAHLPLGRTFGEWRSLREIRRQAHGECARKEEIEDFVPGVIRVGRVDRLLRRTDLNSREIAGRSLAECGEADQQCCS